MVVLNKLKVIFNYKASIKINAQIYTFIFYKKT